MAEANANSPDPDGRGMARACGALGSFEAGRVEGIAAGFGAPLREVHRDHASSVWLDRRPTTWAGEDGARGLAWPERVPDRLARARSWRDAAGSGCGLVIDDEWRAVHGSVSGIGPLYWLADGAAIYFATAIEPLVGAVRSPLSVDWESWASIIALGYPCGDGTPFLEIKRLDPLGLLSFSPDSGARARAGSLAWAEVEPADAPDLAERIVAALRQEIGELDADVELLCPLTGGRDSRLLLCLLVERELDPSTWTINADDGDEREEELAAMVAARLGVQHSVVEPPARPFADEFCEAVVALEHESMLRVRLARLARGLADHPGLVVDGLAGDIFIHDRYTPPAVLEAPDWRAGVGIMLESWTSARPGLAFFRPSAWDALRGSARESFLRDAERFAGHPAVATLSRYWSRIRRGISLSPVRLAGRYHEVAMPFLADECVRSAILAPPATKQGGVLYRRVLEVANAEVGRLPSTRDDLPKPPRTRPRRDRTAEARRAYLPLLAACPLRPWFSEELESALERGKLGPLLRTGWGMGRIQTLCNLTLWAGRHRDSVSDLDPSPLFIP